ASMNADVIWSRVGPARSRRWGVRTGTDFAILYTQLWTNEHVSLLLVPWFGQLLLLLAIGFLPVYHQAVPFLILMVEIVVTGSISPFLRYRYILPLWLYPTWLRPVREKERDELRRLRASHPPGRPSADRRR